MQCQKFYLDLIQRVYKLLKTIMGNAIIKKYRDSWAVSKI